jgi:predicted aconitase with swiveling domain
MTVEGSIRGGRLVEGIGSGTLLRLDEPLSFWGGVDPATGRITQVRHPQCGESVAGRMLALPGTIGSSSSSAVMLELIRGGHAPAGLILIEPDAILLLGCIVANEMGWAAPPAVQVTAAEMAELTAGSYRIDADGLRHIDQVQSESDSVSSR